MKKGQSSTLVVLALEIASIVILHEVKLSHSGKNGNKEVGKAISTSMQPESRMRSSISIASFQ
jgi:hypothetical protein